MSNVPKVKKVKQILKKKQSTTSLNINKPSTNPSRVYKIVSPESSRNGIVKCALPQARKREKEMEESSAALTMNGISKPSTSRNGIVKCALPQARKREKEVEESSAALTMNGISRPSTHLFNVTSSQEHSDKPPPVIPLGKRRSMDRVAMKGGAVVKKQQKSVNHQDESDEKSDENTRIRRAEVIQKWADSIILGGINGLKTEFKARKNTVANEECVIFHKNMAKNRYPNIPCLDKTRFILPDDEGFYIHANRVKICPKVDRFICTQAPLATTIDDFWRMVGASETSAIVMLCGFVEDGTPKCAKYFPEAGQTLDLPQFRIVNESTTDFLPDSKDKIQQSQLKVTWKTHNNNNNKELRLTHYLWTNWPDHGVPERSDTILALLANIRKEVKIVVHCSAGVGRTGTFVLVESLIMSMTYPKKFVIKDAFARLRAGRAKSVQTLPQYVFAIRCALEHAYSSKFSVKRNPVEWEKFNEEYNKFMTKKRKKTDGKQLRRKVSSTSCENDDEEKEGAPAPAAPDPTAPPAPQQEHCEVTAAAPDDMNTAKPVDPLPPT